MTAQIYLNNAATSHPKPTQVVESVSRWLTDLPTDSGRDSGAGEDPRSQCRREIAALLNVSEPARVVILPSATYALNLVVDASVEPGDHVVTTQLEHNSLLRPLAHLAQSRRIRVTHVPPNTDGKVPIQWLEDSLSPSTKLLAVSHACNVTGGIQDVEEIAGLAAEAGVPFLIDASQSVGAVDLDYDNLPGRVHVAFAGHKGLLGPPGVGCLIVPDGNTAQTVVGGTGIRSEGRLHPPELPLRHEAGTPNYPGVAGLSHGVRFVRERGVDTEGRHRDTLVHLTRERLAQVKGAIFLPLPDDDGRAGIVSFNLEGHAPDALAHAMQQIFGIHTRAGLHCAPLIHQTMGTAPLGTIRASFGWANTESDVDALVDAVDQLKGH